MQPTLAARIVLAALVVLPQPIAAAIITVEDGCTLFDAITAANTDTATGDCPAGSGADEVRLTADVTHWTDRDYGFPSVTSEIVIEGNDFAVQRQAGAPDFRIFHVGSSGDLTLQNTTVRNGSAVGPWPAFYGGGIYNEGTLTLTNSTLSGNSAAGGGGISNYYGDATLTNSTLSGNSAAAGGGIHNVFGTLTLTNSTLSGNWAEGYSDSAGGGIFNAFGNVTLTNSTLSGNSALEGGGIYDFGKATLTNSTLSGNSALEGGGIYNAWDTLTLTNSLIANSIGDNCSRTITDHGGNLADDDTCGTVPATLTGLDPVLADNGGPTLTHALLEGSNAIDHAGICGLFNDQRNASRDGAMCDSGAFESQCTAPDGNVLLLEDDTIDDTQLFEACWTITAQNDYVVGSSGDLTLEAGRSVGFGDGFEVATDGSVTVKTQPMLQIGCHALSVVASYGTSDGEPENALGAPYLGQVPANWDDYAVRIWGGGFVLLDLGEDRAIVDGDGDDLYVEEVDSEDSHATDWYWVLVSADPPYWFNLGLARGDSTFDLAGQLPAARYVMIESDIEHVEIDGIYGIHCDTPPL